MIPKIIHYIWLSENPISNIAERCIASWKRQAPDYEIRRWKLSDFTEDEFPSYVREALEKKKWAFASDYLRAYVLYKDGGLYLDTDVFMIKPVDPYLTHSFISSVEYMEDLFDKEEQSHIDENGLADKENIQGLALNAAMMASIPGHPFLKDVMNHYENIHFILDGEVKTDIVATQIYSNIAVKYGFRYKNIEQDFNEDMHLYSGNIFAPSFIDSDGKNVMVHLCAASWRELTQRQKELLQEIKRNQIDYLETRDYSRPYLSIVVLCYKVAAYLPQCLESIRRQKFRDFEVIMVDDGSPDACGAICDAYAGMDPRFKVIHKENGGIIAARKDALHMARGYFAGSVDGDDWISLDMYKDMWRIQCDYNCDVVQVRFLTHYTDHSEESCNISGLPEYTYYSEEVIHEILSEKEYFQKRIIEVSLCRSILKTDRLREIMDSLDDECSLCEDAICTYVYAADIKNLCVINKEYYHYRMRSNSCTTSLKTRDVNCLYKLFDTAKELLKDKPMAPHIEKQLAVYFVQHCFTSFIMNINRSPNKKEEFINYVEDNRFKNLLSYLTKEEVEKQLGPVKTMIIYRDADYEKLFDKLVLISDFDTIFK